MKELEDLIHYTYPNLFELGYGEQGWRIGKDLRKMKKELQPTVIDKMTMDLIELDELFKTMDYTMTGTGARVLYRSLLQPPTSLELIHAKQESLKDIGQDTELRGKLNDYIFPLVEMEDDTIYYLNGDWRFRSYAGPPYSEYRNTGVFFSRMVDGINNLPPVQSPYLQILLNDIERFSNTHTMDMIRGPVFSTFGGLKHRGEVGLFTPRIKFAKQALKPIFLGGMIASTIAFGPAFMAQEEYLMAPIAMWMFTAFAGMLFAASYDKHYFFEPLRDMYVADEDLRRGIEAVGKIDELLSFHKYSETLDDYATIPVVTDNSPHYFVAEGAKNPVLMSMKNIEKYGTRELPCGGCGECGECEEDNENYNQGLHVKSVKEPFCIPNDLRLDGQKTTVITGPNSGGKTTTAKTIAQLQIQSQVGSYVPAKSVEATIADRIFYQAPMFDSLKNPEGRFGTELARTRNIFFKTTPRSLVILDDSLAGATTHKETVDISYIILDGFHKIGNNTLLITHNTDLARKLYEEERGKYLQVGFRDGAATYRILSGISDDSHSEAVAKAINFDYQTIKDHLKKEKYVE